MSQRGSGYERKERDLYETPEWVTRALLLELPAVQRGIWEPACGSGKMSTEICYNLPNMIFCSDIEPSIEADRLDFLSTDGEYVSVNDIATIITNPPYDQAREFCEHAVGLMRQQRGLVAMLLRTDFDHAKSRFHLFRDCPAFAKKLVLARRVVWFVEDDGKPKAQPSFNHAWFIWDWQHDGPPTIAYA